MEPLSVCVIACNEQEELPRCLASVDFADEIVVVVDAKSCDQTLEIAQKSAHHVEVRSYEGDIEQKRYCASLASHDWVLIVDPDEVVSPALRASLGRVLGAPAAAGYELDRVTFHLGRWIRHGDFYPDWKLRLYRRSRARWVGRNPHGRVEVDGRVERVEGVLEHYSFRDFSDQLARIGFHTDQAARALFEEGRRARWHHLLLRPPARFLRGYLLKQGFRDGVPGLLIAVAVAFSVFAKYAKLWELRQRSDEEKKSG